MDIFYQSILPSLLVGLISLWLGHWLGRRGESVDRRRIFKSKLRDLGSKAREHHAMYLWKFYDDYRDAVRSACLAVEPDVPWIRKRKFRKLMERFLALGDADLNPPNTFSADDKETRKREFQKVCVNLQMLLNDLADLA